MIVNCWPFVRCLRRMFPLLGVTLSGLQPDCVYDVTVDFVPVNHFRYRYVYHQSRWIINGCGIDDMLQTQSCQHPSSLTRLRETTVTFDKLKLTNNPSSCNKHVRLSCHMQCTPTTILSSNFCLGQKSYKSTVFFADRVALSAFKFVCIMQCVCVITVRGRPTSLILYELSDQ